MGLVGAPSISDSGKSFHSGAGFEPVVIGATLMDAQCHRNPLDSGGINVAISMA
jgi:hypothetical protein